MAAPEPLSIIKINVVLRCQLISFYDKWANCGEIAPMNSAAGDVSIRATTSPVF
jgi:hypothetical protein